MDNSPLQEPEESIAIIGMAGRFPGANSIEGFWQNLKDGVESISHFTDEELVASGVAPALFQQPNYVRAAAILDDVESFDASFFGYSPREAEILDPQQRFILESAWEALERAGYNSDSYKGSIGVFASATMSTYVANLLANHELMESVGAFQVRLGNDKDHLPTRVSYELNLKGPSVAIQSACSSSLVAVHMACYSLLSYQCDMALAGGISISIPQKIGYLYRGEGILSPDGRCRAFDAKAQGCGAGSGAGIVVLKRLSEAIADGDCIHAVIKGTASNNDGSSKVGFTAPGVQGQAEVIMIAQGMAGVKPDSISYVETHGTGTALGDPIEIAALSKVFGASTARKGFCALGALKTNIGHLDAAAGVAGLIKTVLAMKHRLLPPSLHFQEPNPRIDFANSCFYVNTELAPWTAGDSPRRAGVSSFGIGGTNAHVVIEEAPPVEPSGPSRPWQLLMLSAKTQDALDAYAVKLTQFLKQDREIDIADVAYTLQVGRRHFNHRRMLVCQSADDAASALELHEERRISTNLYDGDDRETIFMFPGLGDHYVNMAFGLYQHEPAFREQIDLCSELLKEELKLDLRDVLYSDRACSASLPEKPNESGATPQQSLDLRRMLRRGDVQTDEKVSRLNQTYLSQPAVFVTDYALAKMWMSWGVQPQAMVGYSIGEYVAACLAGVMSLEDALKIVVGRAKMIQRLDTGAMLAVTMGEKALGDLPDAQLGVAAINGPSLCVVAGPIEAVAELERQLSGKGIISSRVQSTHAFHCRMMAPIKEEFAELMKTVRLNPPSIPYVSNVTGAFITEQEATDPNYWVRHTCGTVRFADAIEALRRDSKSILIEVGPGQTLSSFVMQGGEAVRDNKMVTVATVRNSYERQPDVEFLVNNIGKFWLAGGRLNWMDYQRGQARMRVELPTYPFERRRYWVEYDRRQTGRREMLPQKLEIADWFYLPTWKRTLPVESNGTHPESEHGRCWIILLDNLGMGSEIARRMRDEGRRVISVRKGEHFNVVSKDEYIISPAQKEHYEYVIGDLLSNQAEIERIISLWEVTAGDEGESAERRIEGFQHSGFYSLLYLAQALGRHLVTDEIEIDVISTNLYEVNGSEELIPDKATLLGPCKVIPQEYPTIRCRSIDIDAASTDKRLQIKQLIDELEADAKDTIVAYRGKHRWVQTYDPVRIEKAEPGRLRKEGVYLITGGLGKVGGIISEYLADTAKAKLVLTGSSYLPGREQWDQWLATHDEGDEVSRKIKRLRGLEERGAQVLAITADVAEEEQMRAVIAMALERFGELHGAIHLAGVIDDETLKDIQHTEREAAERHFRPKIEGVKVLEKVLEGKELDFCALFSSSSAIFGGLGFITYAAANIFMDAFVHRHNQAANSRWTSLDWDTWGGKGVRGMKSGAGTSLARSVMTDGEGVTSLMRALSLTGASQIIISVLNLQERLAQWVNKEPLKSAGSSNSEFTYHPRPLLRNEYAPPRNETERSLIEIWQEMLGIEQVGIHDNFFELGGNSLLGTRIISRLRKAFEVDMPVRALFDAPTVAELAETVVLMAAEEVSDDILAQALQDL